MARRAQKRGRGALSSDNPGERQSADALSFLYLIARQLLGILLGRLRNQYAKDIDIAVL
jgi:hypothetical protein